MASLDVSDVLDDPDFNAPFQVRQREVGTCCNGLAQGIGGFRITSGVIIPDGGRDLIQSGDGNEITGDITIYTRFPLTAGDAELDADQVFADGAFYTVINAQLWQFGSGYTRAVCKLASTNPSRLGSRDDGGFLG